VYYAVTGWHERFFQTPVLSIAVFAASEQMATTLKRWTEGVLAATNQQAEGDWFFFSSVDLSSASPEDMFLSPVWESAFSTTKTPLIVLAGDA
jgi:hypothetical protein